MTATSSALSLGIAGIATWFDGIEDRVALERAIYLGTAPPVSRPVNAPDFAALCARLVRGAIADAALDRGTAWALIGAEGSNTSALLEQVRARCDAAVLPSSSRSAGSFAAALLQAHDLLSSGSAEAVVLVSVLPPGSPAVRCGGCALVLVPAARLPATRRAYALVESASVVESGTPHADDLRWGAELALGEAGIEGRDIGYVELAGAGAASDALLSLGEALRLGAEPICAVGTAAASLGACSASAALLRGALALHRRFLPRFPGGATPEGSPFFVPELSRPFFAATGQRRALVQIVEASSATTLILREPDAAAAASPAYVPVSPATLLAITADDPSALLKTIESCEARLAAGTSPNVLASDLAARSSRHPGAGARLAILGRGAEGLRAEVRAALHGVPRALSTGTDWQTPAGSAFAPNPLGTRGQVAFVYPGAFSAYVGVARDAFQLFPWLHEPGHGLPEELASTFGDGLVWPRFRAAPSADERSFADARLYDDNVAVFSTSAATSVLYTRVLGEVFGVTPRIAFGYSLGEGIMFSALGVWNDPDLQRSRLQASDLFRTRLAGPRDALRAFWQDRGVACPSGPAPWATYVVKTSVDRVRDAVRRAPNVFLSIINTPEEVVIGGMPDDCARLVTGLQCGYMKLPYAQLLHTEIIATEEEEIARQHSFAIRSRPPVTFYSATGDEPFTLETDVLARTLARMAREPLDFPRLVDRVWNAGARIFLELGGGTSCSRLIAANLQGREHVTIAVDRREVDTETSVARAVARLWAHGVPVNLGALLGEAGARS
jgi:PfaB family protein